MMKLTALFLALILPSVAGAYVSNQGADPANGSYESEYKSAQKSTTASYSDAISRGHGLFYDITNTAAGAYSVSRYNSGSYNTAAVQNLVACIARRDVATGDTSVFPCVTRGYVDYARYAVHSGLAGAGALAAGGYLCVNTADTGKGVLVPCGSGIVSNIISLEAKSANTSGSDLKVLIQSR